jgi:hypothetical protein
MKLDWKNRLTLSLQVRVTALVLTIFMAGIWLLSFYSHEVQREDTVKLLGKQQTAMASYVATEIDQELEDRARSLEKIADLISPLVPDDINRAQQLLEQLLIFQKLFNGGAFITDIRGIAIASVPVSAERHGIDYLDRDYISAAIAGVKVVVGQPVMGRALKSPVFGMSVPVRNQRGEVIGALAGITDLGAPNFLDHITKAVNGSNGYLLLVDAKSRMIITNTSWRRQYV